VESDDIASHTRINANLSDNYNPETQDYYWIFPANSYRDAAGNYLPAQVVSILGPTGSPPSLLSQSPSTSYPSVGWPSVIGVPVGTNIVLTFNENVVAGSGNITIHKISDGSIVETIPAAGGLVTGSGTATITVNPAADLAPNTGYYINVDSSAITDTDGAAYPGITNSATFTFTTGDSTPPVLVSATPAAGATGVAIDTDLVFVFNESVYARSCTTGEGGNNMFTVHLASDGSIVYNTSTGSGSLGGGTPPWSLGCAGTGGSQITWDLSPNLWAGTDYYINIAANALEDSGNNVFPGVLDSTTLTFTTAD
jgi:hypothetical protein